MTYRHLFVLALVGAFLPSVAAAQSSTDQRAFVSVYLGAQTGENDVVDGLEFTVYDEKASVGTTQTYNGGTLFAFGGGVKVAGQIFVGAQFSRTSDQAVATASAQIPNPIVFARPRAASLSAEDFKHSERALHLLAGYWLPVSDSFDVMVSGGPTFFSITHEIINSVDFIESVFPFNTVTLSRLNGVERSESSVGFNIGAEAMYLATPRVGIGGFARLAKGSVDLQGGGGSGTVNMDVGGFQLGVGVRFGF